MTQFIVRFRLAKVLISIKKFQVTTPYVESKIDFFQHQICAYTFR
jgi:hypothetical protein